MNPPNRLVSLDAFRGFIMLLMASSGLGFAQMAQNAGPDSGWRHVAWQVSHVPWQGAALWDMIQPAFMFMVGIAVPLSVARRKQAGQGFMGMLGHAVVRSLLLILLAVVLSTGSKDPQTNWIFTNVLAQIGLGFTFLFILARLGWEYSVSAIVVIVVGYWYWFFQHPLPGPDFDFAAAGAAKEDLLPGMFGHWSKGLNAAADFDRWFLNLFPRAEPFVVNSGGYTTLNFIPALATMLGGSVTGALLMQSPRTHAQKCGMLVIAAVVCLLVGTLMGIVACPVVKRIWTPSWVFFSGGWVLLMLSFFYWLVEVANVRRLVFPLVVVGMNSLFIYVMSQLTTGWIKTQLAKHGMAPWFEGFWGPFFERSGVLAVLWLLCFWLYRQKAFLRF